VGVEQLSHRRGSSRLLVLNMTLLFTTLIVGNAQAGGESIYLTAPVRAEMGVPHAFAFRDSLAKSGLPVVPSYPGPARNNLRVKPPLIAVAGTNVNAFAGYGRSARVRRAKLRKLRWHIWDAYRATATGGYWRSWCLPDCATGWLVSYRVKLTLDRPRILGGHLVFTRLRAVYTDYRARVTMSLKFENRGYFWNTASYRGPRPLPLPPGVPS
jgi:hypothetical protein